MSALVVLAVALATLKPWDWAGGLGATPDARPPAEALLGQLAGRPTGQVQGATSRPAVSGRSDARSAASAAPSAGDDSCLPVAGWRLFTVERESLGIVLSWYSLLPAEAPAPEPSAERQPGLTSAPPNVPIVEVHASRLLALGYCVAALPGQVSRLGPTEAWRLSSPPSQLALLSTSAFAPRDPNRGALFDPPAANGAAATTWPAGPYLFRVPTGSGGSRGDWFEVDVVPAGS